MAGLLDLLKKEGGQYLRDIMPGGLLNPEWTPERTQMALSGLLDVTPVVGDIKSGYEGVQAARQGDMVGAGLGALGALPFVPALGTKLYHGSKTGVDWLTDGKGFDAAFPSANMRSKYMWGNPKKEIADGYAGISDMAIWKYENGMGSKPLDSAGVASFELKKGAKGYKLTDIRKVAEDFGVTVKGNPNWLEEFADAAKLQGFDYIKNTIDGGNVAILNPDVVVKAAKVK
jgi:hypothetical protein